MSAEHETIPGELYCPTCEQAFHVGERCPDDGTRLVRLATHIDPFLGRELDGRFTVIEKLGQGGMGAVYRGNQHSVGREVAIKVVNPGLVSQPDVIIVVATGTDNTCAIDTVGNVMCWGYNAHGEVGNGTSFAPTPQPIQFALH